MSKFKIGDRVVLTKSSYKPEETIGATGTVVAIDNDGDELIKLDKDIDSYCYCYAVGYKSDKKDLIIIEKTEDNDYEIQHLN